MNNKQEFLLEEYKQIRSELMERERSINNMATVAIVASTTLASALITIFLKELNGITNNISFPFHLLFLTPLCISIPLFFVLMSHRKDLFRAGAYIQVFYEENGVGIAWQTRIGKFRNKMRGNPLDTFPIIFWVIFLLCAILCCLTSQKQFIWYYWPQVILITMAFVFQMCAYIGYQKASKSYRDKCIHTWRMVRESEGSSDDISDSINVRSLRMIHCIFNLLK